MPEPSGSPLRRAALLGLAGALAAAIAAPAAAEVRTIPAKRLWPYFDAFSRIPAQDQTRFHAVYYARTTAAPAVLTLIVGGRRTPIPLARGGRVLREPTLSELSVGQVEIDCPEKVLISMQLEPTAPAAAEMDAGGLVAAIAQAAAGVKRMAPGPLQLAAPKMKAAGFRGVSAGEVVFADGRRAALPLVEGRPVFEPAKFPGAKAVRFATAPTSVDIRD